MDNRVLLACLSFALVLSGCEKQPDEVFARTGDGDYLLYAEDVTTRTVTDASFNVKWADGDNLAVYTWPSNAAVGDDTEHWQKTNPVAFVAEPGDANPRPFRLSETDVENSFADGSNFPYSDRLEIFKTRFSNNNSLKWGVIYPGRMAASSKAGMGLVIFGKPDKMNCTQIGNDNMDHLASQDVLWGMATGKGPTVAMKHLGTMMAYKVKNMTSSEFTVQSITIKAPGVAIGGEFRLNVFEGTFGEPMNTVDECTLKVVNGTPVPVGGSSMFYQVLAPFTLGKGATVTLTVKTDKGSWSETMTMDSAVSFESGKLNTSTLYVKYGIQNKPTVEIRNKKLYVNGAEFFVKGAALNGDNKDVAGKQEFWKQAKAAGANVVRLYSVSSATRPLLDELAAAGMYAYVGLNVGRIVDGFDYLDETARTKQREQLKSIINNLKGHPAILMWCIGNELEQNNKSDGTQIDTFGSPEAKNLWADVNEISQYIHSVDGRPTTFALCWPWGVNNYVPDINLISINSYPPTVYVLHNNMTAKVSDKPYLVTEFGPQGTWEDTVGKTSWGGLIEDTGSVKAAEYKKIYSQCISAHQNDGCIGSFVFLWGYQSHGTVPTWYAMYDQFSKYSLPSVDAMNELWSGTVSNRAPVISGFTVNGQTADKSVKLMRGEIAAAAVESYDPDGDAQSWCWKIVEDKYLSPGTLMPDTPALVVGTVGSSIRFKAPETRGAYRLIVWAQDAAHRKADIATFPFYVTTELSSYTYGDGIDKWGNGNNVDF